MKIHNLDESVNEYFEFIVRGYKYKFNHPNTEQLDELRKLGNDEEKSRQFLFKFIEKIDPKAPNFKDISKSMIAPHWVLFKKMMISEFGV